MSIFAQEEVTKLERDLHAAQRANQALEADKERLSSLLAQEKHTAIEAERTAEAALRDAAEAQRKLSDALATVGRAAGHERAKDAAEARAITAESALLETQGKLDRATGKLNKVKDDLAAARAISERLEAEIGPFRRLIAALKARGEADGQIAVELKRLDS